MLIRELEQKTGLERATIRFYEKEGFITPTRQENGYRAYSQDDSETLLKIKLLRQLGIPLDRIRALQQGSEDFATALTEQVNKLEHQMQDAERAKEVCQKLRDAGVTYASLDAAHYLRELTRVRPAKPAWTPQPVPEFKQTTPTHPWRRYFARMIDYSLLNMAELFLLVVVLRIRPVNDFVYTVFGFAIVTHLLWIPIEGLLLHCWGTTPGKWIMGIHIESENGGKLSISDAMSRAWDVLMYGFGFTIPIYGLWRLYRSYKDYVEGGYTRWDREWKEEIQFRYYYDVRKKVTIGAVIAVYLLVCLVTFNDTVLPVHRGEDLTVAQIAQNHNDYLETVYEDKRPPTSLYLLDNGQWRKTQSVATIIIGSKPVNGDANYEYEIEHGYVRSIRYEQAWTEVAYLRPIGNDIQCTILAVAGAQEWASFKSLSDFGDALDEEFKQRNGHLIYENLEIRWTTELENCICNTGGTYYADDKNIPSSVKLNFELIIHPAN